MRVLFMILCFSVFMSAGAYAQETKIGYLDLQAVIRDSKAGKAAKASFEAEFKQKQGSIESKRAQLERLKDEFINSGPVMNEATRKQKAEQIENMEKELQRSRTDFRDELQRRDLELLEKILQDLDGILKSIGQSGGYTIILERSEAGIVYGVPSEDVTQQVIQAYDAKN